MTLVRHIPSDKPCELLGMTKYWVGREMRLIFALRDGEGGIIGCGGLDIERWSAPVHKLCPQQPRPLDSCGQTDGLSPVGRPSPIHGGE